MNTGAETKRTRGEDILLRKLLNKEVNVKNTERNIIPPEISYSLSNCSSFLGLYIPSTGSYLDDRRDDSHGLLRAKQDLRVGAVRDGVDDAPPHEHHRRHHHVPEADGREVGKPERVLLFLRGRRQQVPPLFWLRDGFRSKSLRLVVEFCIPLETFYTKYQVWFYLILFWAGLSFRRCIVCLVFFFVVVRIFSFLVITCTTSLSARYSARLPRLASTCGSRYLDTA